MLIVLEESMFVNNKLLVSYGTRQQAEFTIIDEEFMGANNLGRVNRVTCLIRKFDAANEVISTSIATTVIGIGDGKVGVTSDNADLRGKMMTHQNMAECVVELYED
jgi:hypothetical protein